MFWKKKRDDENSAEKRKLGLLQRLAMNPAPQKATKGSPQRNIKKTPKINNLDARAAGLWCGVKKVMSMDPKEREKLMQKALAPENIEKNKDKILATMEQMKESGQLTEEQMKIARGKLGI